MHVMASTIIIIQTINKSMGYQHCLTITMLCVEVIIRNVAHYNFPIDSSSKFSSLYIISLMETVDSSSFLEVLFFSLTNRTTPMIVAKLRMTINNIIPVGTATATPKLTA